MTATHRHSRHLIVNADDFGQSPGINSGIMRAHEHGIVTSASMMVRWPSAWEAARYGRDHLDGFSLGLHVDLGEWRQEAAGWTSVYEVVPPRDRESVDTEVRRQLATFERLVGAPPTHIDSHQHVHRHEPIRTVLARAADELEIPIRHITPGVSYCGGFYGRADDGSPRLEAISVHGLLEILARLPEGVTELACHPAEAVEVTTDYSDERLVELRTLCHPAIRSALQDLAIGLASFRDVHSEPSGSGIRKA